MVQWKRNLYVTWFTQILSLAGFGFMHPFLPFFIQEIGVTDPDAIRRWVGITTATPSLILGLMGPVWGILSDKFGRKLMILRAMCAGSIMLLAMSYAKSVEMVLLLRVFQGLFAGTVTAAATLVAAGTPRERLSSSLGFLSSSNFIGFSLGPMIGGITAEYFGYRVAFRIGSITLLVAFVLVLIFTQDVRVPKPTKSRERPRETMAKVFPVGFLICLALLFLIRFARALPASFIPLHIQEIRGTVEGASVVTGLLSAAIGGVAAISGLTIARLGDRINKLTLISRLLWISALCALPLFFTRGVWDFGVCYIVVAFFMGGVEPNLQSYLSERTDSSSRGMVFGAIALVGGFGWSAAPLLGSVVSIGLGIRWLFLFYAIGIGISYFFLRIVKNVITDGFQGSSHTR
jgi:MFS transporter, DHA1 family, multidrug resistance protein